MAVIPLKSSVKLLPDGTQSSGARFEIERVLSAGGFGITYLARDFQFDDTCVVKELAMGEIVGRDTMTGALEPLPGRDQDVAYWVDKVVREARLLNRVRHEAVVGVRAAWQERGTAYFAMDHIDGVEFPSAQEAGWSWSHCEPLFFRMLEGLQAIHAAGLVHSDIKPSNILVKRNGQPVFIDFGTARTGEEMGKTRLTTVAFTPGYAPPELESRDRGKEVGPWSDLYSLAMVFIGLFAVHPGLEGNPLESRMRETLARHSAGADPYNAALRATMISNGMSRAWAELLMDCVAVEPSKRPQSVEEFLTRLKRRPSALASATAATAAAGSASSGQPAAVGPSKRQIGSGTGGRARLATPRTAPPKAPRKAFAEASLWALLPRRLGAQFFDIFWALLAAFAVFLALAWGPHVQVEDLNGFSDEVPTGWTKVVAALVALVTVGPYLAYQISAMRVGQTLGKRELELEIHTKDGRPASAKRMLWRLISLPGVLAAFACLEVLGPRSMKVVAELGLMTFFWGNFGLYLFNRGRGFQDVFAGTYVAKKD